MAFLENPVLVLVSGDDSKLDPKEAAKGDPQLAMLRDLPHTLSCNGPARERCCARH
jgi:hypothetical protein